MKLHCSKCGKPIIQTELPKNYVEKVRTMKLCSRCHNLLYITVEEIEKTINKLNLKFSRLKSFLDD